MSKPSSEPDKSVVTVRSSRHFREQQAWVRDQSGPFFKKLDVELSRAVRLLENPEQAFAEYRKLEKQLYDFTGVFRYKGLINQFNRGVRVFYIGCDVTNRVLVLEYGERNPGDPNDAYMLFGARLKRGDFDAHFQALGQKHAYWQIPDAPVPLSGKK